MNFYVLNYPYKSLGKPCDLLRGRLDTRLFTPITMHEKLLRYRGIPSGSLLDLYWSIWDLLDHLIVLACGSSGSHKGASLSWNIIVYLGIQCVAECFCCLQSFVVIYINVCIKSNKSSTMNVVWFLSLAVLLSKIPQPMAFPIPNCGPVHKL